MLIQGGTISNGRRRTSAVAGSYWIAASGVTEAQVGELVDKALKDSFVSRKMGDTMLALINVELADFVDAMGGGKLALGHLPKRMNVSVGNGGASLFLRVRFQ